MKHRYVRQIVLPLLAAIIWGTSFVFQSDSTAFVGPFTFTALRSSIGALFLALVLLVRRLVMPKRPSIAGEKGCKKALLVGGLLCGTVLAFATNLQQSGMSDTSPGKAAFITALYVVLVPVAGLLLFRKRQPLSVWIGVVIALGGLYLLCMGDGESISNSDVFLLLCALAFTAHILVIDRFSPHVDGIALSCVQFAVVAVWSSIGMLLTEQPTLEGIMACIGPILYVGLMSSGIAYTLQILAQKGSNSAVVSLLLCMESVFASIAEALMHGTWMSGRETIGAALMLTAVILAQIPRKAWGRVFKKVK